MKLLLLLPVPLACAAILLGGSSVARAADPLTYHGGPVVHENTAYAIYWAPPGFPFDAGYEAEVDRFLTNVSQSTDDPASVYAVAAQYSDAAGPTAVGSAFGGGVRVTDAFPTSGCVSSKLAVCLSPAQIQAELGRVAEAQHWPRGMGSIFFLLTPRGVGSCSGESNTRCTYDQNCAYHAATGSGDGLTLYAYLPSQDAPPGSDLGCDSGSRPNGNAADPEIDALSHEHIEILTDPLQTAWYDAADGEIADKCRSTYGPALGRTVTGEYNQVLGTGHYWLQQQWSNAAGRCVGQAQLERPPDAQEIRVSLARGGQRSRARHRLHTRPHRARSPRRRHGRVLVGRRPLHNRRPTIAPGGRG